MSADKELSATTAGAQSPVVEELANIDYRLASIADALWLLIDHLGLDSVEQPVTGQGERAAEPDRPPKTQERRPSRDTKERSED